MNYVKVEERRDYVRGATRDPNRRYVLPISKLQGVANRVRLTLKAHRITTCEQLLAAAGHSQPRAALVQKTQLDPAMLFRVVRRADMTRINGIGVVFGRMLEELGVSRTWRASPAAVRSISTSACANSTKSNAGRVDPRHRMRLWRG